MMSFAQTVCSLTTPTVAFVVFFDRYEVIELVASCNLDIMSTNLPHPYGNFQKKTQIYGFFLQW